MVEIEEGRLLCEVQGGETGEEIRQAFGGREELPDDWRTTAKVDLVVDTARKILGVSSRQRKEDKEVWWWDKEVYRKAYRRRDWRRRLRVCGTYRGMKKENKSIKRDDIRRMSDC